MQPIVISPKAYKDIEEIKQWYNENSIQAAGRFLEELNFFINKAAKNPERYKKVDNHVRRCLLNVFPYIIYFSQEQDTILVLRIRHSKRRPLIRFT